MKELFKKLDGGKLQISERNKLIKMDLFLSFLTVGVTRSRNHLGSDNGWTLLTGEDNLKIGGGIYNGCEYLDSLQYKKNIGNPYNNYVNPFYLFDIFNDDGKRFFINYYKDDIDRILSDCDCKIEICHNTIKEVSSFRDSVLLFLNNNR